MIYWMIVDLNTHSHDQYQISIHLKKFQWNYDTICLFFLAKYHIFLTVLKE